MAEVIWTKRANRERIAILTYGAETFGKRSAEKLNEYIESCVVLFVGNPHLGGIEPLLVGRIREYRSFVVHEHYKLVYYLKGNTIYIVDLWDTRREPAKLARRIRSK